VTLAVVSHWTWQSVALRGVLRDVGRCLPLLLGPHVKHPRPGDGQQLLVLVLHLRPGGFQLHTQGVERLQTLRRITELAQMGRTIPGIRAA